MLLALPVVTSAAPAENTDRSAGAAFQTRTTGSRRRQTAIWSASLAGQPAAPAVVPAAAWFTAPRPRRRTTEREIVAPEPIQWKYIAPTMAAILKPERPKVVAFPRKLRVPLDQPSYPATPATGPPFTAWVAAARRAVSQDRRIQRLPEQPVYPATPAAEVTDRTAGESFQTRISRSRRRLTAPDVIGVGAAAPAVAPYIDAPKAIRRRELARTLRTLAVPPVYPETPKGSQGFPAWRHPKAHRAQPIERAVQRLDQPAYPPTPPAVSEATIAAVVGQRAKRRKGRPGLFLSAGGSPLSVASTATTPAVYPSFVPTGFLSRRETERRLIVVIDAPVFPPTPVVEVTDRTVGASFQTRVTRSRRLQTLPAIIGVDAAPPVTSEAPIAALMPARSIRRKSRPGLFLGGMVSVDGFTVPTPEAAFRLPKQHRSAGLGRRMLREPLQLEHPPTPPTPPQPEAAFRLPIHHRAAGLGRTLMPAAPQLEHPPTPPPVPGLEEWIIRARRRGRR